MPSSTWPQTEHVRVRLPVSTQLASFVTVHSPYACGFLSEARVSFLPQTLHLRVSSPFSVQVASFTVFHLPQLWPAAGIVSYFS